MQTFLLAVLAIFVVLGVLFLALIVWLRKRVRKAVGDYKLFTPFLIAQRARIKLKVQSLPDERDHGENEGGVDVAAINKLWAGLAVQGMEQVATLATDDGDTVYVAAQHPDNKIVALVVASQGRAPFLEFIALAANNSVNVISGNPEARAVRLPSMSFEPHTRPSFDRACLSFAATPAHLALDTRMLILLIERIHAARMDSQLGRAPTLDDIRLLAAARGVELNLDPEQQERVLEMNRNDWTHELQVALRDNAKRKMKLDEDAWSRLADELIVIHQGMNEDEVIATLSEHDLVDRLGQQLKRQNFGPGQIFDEINRRLDPDDQRQQVVRMTNPVPARVFARTGALQAAGVELQGLAA